MSSTVVPRTVVVVLKFCRSASIKPFSEASCWWWVPGALSVKSTVPLPLSKPIADQPSKKSGCGIPADYFEVSENRHADEHSNAEGDPKQEGLLLQRSLRWHFICPRGHPPFRPSSNCWLRRRSARAYVISSDAEVSSLSSSSSCSWLSFFVSSIS